MSVRFANLTLTMATMNDAARLYTWRTDSATVKNSLQPPPKSFAMHCEWLKEKLTDTDHTCIWIAEDRDRTPSLVGMVRLDAREEGVTEIAVVVDPRQRGRGYAALLIGAAIENAETAKLRAVVKVNNSASLRAFWAHGFRLVSEDKDLLTLERSRNESAD